MNPYRTREVHPPPPFDNDPSRPVSLDFLDGLPDYVDIFSRRRWIEAETKRRIEWARKNKCEPWA